MQKLTRDDLLSLEAYAEQRIDFRQKVMAHKKNRRLALGDHAALYFEDRLTMQYQIQEMLRIERIFEAAEIEEELNVYNALISEGTNWKATFMIEYIDVEERRQALAKYIGIEDKVWLQVGDLARIYAIANEDLERTTAEKTSAVHFMRFELNTDQIKALKTGANISAGIDHPAYFVEVNSILATLQQSLNADIN